MTDRTEVDAERTLVLTVKLPVFGKRSHLEKTEASIRRFLKAAFGERISVERAGKVIAKSGSPVVDVHIHQSPSMPPGVVGFRSQAEIAHLAAQRERERRRA